jgi:FkbM family methyltransferase
MLISFETIRSILVANNISFDGVFHVGAHECEELSLYQRFNILPENIIWIDAMKQKVVQAALRNIPNVYHAVVTDKDGDTVEFNVASNGQSSSVLEFGTHSTEHPQVTFIGKITQPTITIDTFFKQNGLDASKYPFWNFDIQGAELLALKGATQSIQHAKALYLEVNERELYKGCGMIGEIDEFVAQYGFKRVVTKMTVHGWGDALYIKLSQPVTATP